MRRILGVLLIVIAATVSGSLIYVQATGSKLLSVQSGSMAPHIKKGHLVVVKNVPVTQLGEGDVITFINPVNTRSTITHRILELPSSSNHQKLVTKGDANVAPDGPVDKRAVLGKVTASLPYLGRGIDFIRYPIGLVLLVYLPALAVVVGELKRLTFYYRSQRPYRLEGYKPRLPAHSQTPAVAGMLTLLVVLCFGIALPVKAALVSNSVTLSNSSFSVSTTPPPGPGSDNTNVTIINTNTVTVINVTNQTATTGNVSVDNTTAIDPVLSGNATNSSLASTTITVSN